MSANSKAKSVRCSRINIAKQLIVTFSFLSMTVGCAQVKVTPTSIPEADQSRYVADLEFIAQAPRTDGPHHTAVRDLCASRLTELGYEVERHDFGEGVNIIGTRLGTTRSDEIVIVSAHYDTIPGSNGADDNASGVAGILEAAKLLATEKHARTLIVACWDKEEPALTGSYLYTVREKKKNSKITVAYSLDEIGVSDDRPNSQHFPTGFEVVYPVVAQKIRSNQWRANFVLLVYDKQAQPWAQAIADSAESQGLPSAQLEVDLEGKVPLELKGSDHASFWGKGYPAIDVTDTSEYRNPFKHTKFDTVETLNHDIAIKIISAVTASARNALDSLD
jgi:Zn-dependent M28 family amino/carboxypeptidase